MGIFTKLFGSADRTREVMRDLYAKHLRMAQQGEMKVANIDDAHYIALYTALWITYCEKSGSQVPEDLILAEIVPFRVMKNKQQAIEALAEYVVYVERPSDARTEWLKGHINSAMQSYGDDWPDIALMGGTSGFDPATSWMTLLNPEMKSLLTKKTLERFAKKSADNPFSNFL